MNKELLIQYLWCWWETESLGLGRWNHKLLWRAELLNAPGNKPAARRELQLPPAFLQGNLPSVQQLLFCTPIAPSSGVPQSGVPRFSIPNYFGHLTAGKDPCAKWDDYLKIHPNQEQHENEHSQLPGLLLFLEFSSTTISPQFLAVFLGSSQVPGWCSSPRVTHDDSAPYCTGTNTRRKKGLFTQTGKNPRAMRWVLCVRRSRKVIFALCSAPERCFWRMLCFGVSPTAKKPKSNKLPPATTRHWLPRGSPGEALELLRALQ